MSPPFPFPLSPRSVPPLSPQTVPSSPPTEHIPITPVTQLPTPVSPRTELPKPISPTDDFVFPAPPTTQPQPTSPQIPTVQFTSELGRGWGLGNWFNNVLHTAPVVQNSDPERFQEQLKTLEEMGWYDKEESLKALDKTNGDVLKAVEFLLSHQTSTVTL
jgi:hypothetical protein